MDAGDIINDSCESAWFVRKKKGESIQGPNKKTRWTEPKKMSGTPTFDHNYHKSHLPETSDDLIVSNQQKYDQENLEKDLFKTKNPSVDPTTLNDCNRIHFSDGQPKICDVGVDAVTDKRNMIKVTKNLGKSNIQRVNDDFLEHVGGLVSMKNTERENSKNVKNSVKKSTSNTGGRNNFLVINPKSLYESGGVHKTSDNGQRIVPTSPPSSVIEEPFLNEVIVTSIPPESQLQTANDNSNSDEGLTDVGQTQNSSTSNVLNFKINKSIGQIAGQAPTILPSLGVDVIADVMVQLFNLGQTKYNKFMSVVDKIREEKVLDETYDFLHKQTQDKTTNCYILCLDSTNQVNPTQRKEDVDDSDKDNNTITDNVLDQNAVNSDKSIQEISTSFDRVKCKYNVTELKELRIITPKIDDRKTNKRTEKVIKLKSTFVGPLCKKLAFWKKETLSAKKIKTRTQTSKKLKKNSDVILESYFVGYENICLSKEVTKKNPSKHRILHELNTAPTIKRKSPIPEMKKNKPLEEENPIKKNITPLFVSNTIKPNQSKFNDANIASDINVALSNKTIQSTETQVITVSQSKPSEKSKKPRRKRKSALEVQTPENENVARSLSEKQVVIIHDQPEEPEKSRKLEWIKNKSKTSPIVNKQHNHIDKEYFPTAKNVLKCKFCQFRGTNLPIVEHYKEMHKDEEVLPSRVSDTCAKKLINDSIAHKLGLMNCERLEENRVGRGKRKRKTLSTFYTCIFCRKTINDIDLFSDHTASHTGEYSYQCEFCHVSCASANHLKEHRTTHPTKYSNTRMNVFRLVYPNPIPVKTLYGYLCPFCNYTQLSYTNMIKHMGRYHSAEDKKPNGRWTVIRINMSFDKFNVWDSVSSVDYSNLVGCRPPLYYEENLNSVTTAANVSGGDTSKTTSISSKYKMNLNRNPLSDDFYEKLLNNNLGATSSTDTASPKYMLKKNVRNCYFFNLLSCLQLKAVVLFQCLVPKCMGSSFSTVLYSEFLKHIQMCHESLSWNGVCNVCIGQTKPSTERLYMLDALQHLVQFHLTLCKGNQPSTANAIVVSDTEQNENAKKDAIGQPATAVKLRVRHLPGDKLSSPLNVYPQETSPNILQLFDQDLSVEFNDSNADLTSIADDNIVSDVSSFLESNNQMDISDSRTATNNIRIYNVRTLNEFQDDHVNGKSVSNENIKSDDSDDQQIVNNGQLIDGEFKLMDTDDTKINETRFEQCYNEMSKSVSLHTMTVPNRLGLFKCLEKRCRRIYTDVKSYKRHMLVHYTQPKPKQKRAGEQYKLCCYCYKPFDDLDSLIDHVVEKYAHCLYFCQYCLYRAYTPAHVLAHETKLHPKRKPLVIQMEIDDHRGLLKENVLPVDYSKFVLPYTCDQEKTCLFSCYVVDDFITHLQDVHGKRDTFSCYECTNQFKKECNFSLRWSTSIKTHFEVHSISTYQCIFCLFGADSTEKIILHMAMEHFVHDLICIERRLKNDCSDSTKIENLKIVRLESSIDKSILKKMILPKPFPEISAGLTEQQQTQCTDSIDDTTISTPSFNHLSSSSDNQNPVTSVKSPTTMDDGQMIALRDDEVTRPQCSGLKRKRSVEDSNAVASCEKSVKTANLSLNLCKKRLTFTPRTADQIPKLHILSEPLSCGICLYSTKVRSNLVKHLESHDKCQDFSNVEILNPVPSIEIPHKPFTMKVPSASSHEQFVAAETQTEMDMKNCVEISLPVNLKHESYPEYPKFVKIPARYMCPVRNCTFTGANLKMFTDHLAVKHVDCSYFTCPHCPRDSNHKISLNEMGNHLTYHGNSLYRCYYCPYIHYFSTQVKLHLKNEHLCRTPKERLSSFIVIRGKAKSDNRQELSSTIRWTCNICNTHMLASQQEIEEHNARVHALTKTYSCSVCFFGHDNPETLKEHFNAKHPLLNVEYFQTYRQSEPATVALKRPVESPIDIPAKKVHRKSVQTDNFDKNASLGTIKSNGHYLCPKCNESHTEDVGRFKEHVYQEIDYKTQWKRTGCGEISDSLKDLNCWDNHHGTGDTYKLVEDDQHKFNWVQPVVKYQRRSLRMLNRKAQLKENDQENKVLINENYALAFEDASDIDIEQYNNK
ncbi:LOW QUALITY PROTEIN: uncharacterized protein LOC126836927 [Adelges cooleyi]|uniref:LOW QUALITY PROTEIN: uncharacterized protein LOC126836927 n=1 Tax=Adelges cooleyi TaxID=133065 RepID=UPI0021801E61|nr:LOW QUALITY PROTEIN: uncharacterized protein LOC126836927 [Adelges cooleyi]